MVSKAAKLLPTILKKKGWSQNELERRMGLTGGAVTRWCSGARIPNRINCAWLHSYLELDPSLWDVPAKSGKAA